MAPSCLLVDDSTHFLEAASKLLEGQGLGVVGRASTAAEALACVRELEPDVAIVDIDLNGESGFDLAWRLAAASDGTTSTVLTSTRSESDCAEVVWPEGLATADVEDWKRYEAGISSAMASVPVSFVCAYDAKELPAGIVTDALRTHPVLRTAAGARPSALYEQPAAFVRSLGG